MSQLNIKKIFCFLVTFGFIFTHLTQKVDALCSLQSQYTFCSPDAGCDSFSVSRNSWWVADYNIVGGSCTYNFPGGSGTGRMVTQKGYQCSDQASADRICGGGSGPNDPPVCSSVSVLGKVGASGLDLVNPAVTWQDHPQCGTKDEGDNGLASCAGVEGCRVACYLRVGGQNNDPWVSGNESFNVSYPPASSVRLSVAARGNIYASQLPGGSGPVACRSLYSSPLCSNPPCGCDDPQPAGYGCRKCDPNFDDAWSNRCLSGACDLPAPQSEGNYTPPTKSLSYQLPTDASSGIKPDFLLFDAVSTMGTTGFGQVCSGTSSLDVTNCRLIFPGMNQSGLSLKLRPADTTFTISAFYTKAVPSGSVTVSNVRTAWNANPAVSCPSTNIPLKVIVEASDDKGFSSTNGVEFNYSSQTSTFWTPGNPPIPNLVINTPYAPGPATSLYTQVTDTKPQTAACPPVNFCTTVSNVTISGTVFTDTNGDACSTGDSTAAVTNVLLQKIDRTCLKPDFINGAPYTCTNADPCTCTNSASSYSFTVPSATYTLTYFGTPAGYTDSYCSNSACTKNCGPINLMADTVLNIGVTNNISWFNTYDGDVYGSTIYDPTPPGAIVANNWLINKLLLGSPGAGGVGIAATNNGITTSAGSGNPNHTSTQGNPSPPGWEAANSSNVISYFSSGTIPTNTRSTTPPVWDSLQSNESYLFSTGSGPTILNVNSYTVAGEGIATIFVPGDLLINETSFQSTNNGRTLIIASGNIQINTPAAGGGSQQIDAQLAAHGSITIQGTPDTTVLVRGGLFSAGSPSLTGLRLGSNNQLSPALTVRFEPVYLTNTNEEILQNKYLWQELPPQ